MHRLRELRKERGLTMIEFADDLFIHPRTVHRCESGTSEPVLSTLIRMADYFKVSIDYLVGKSDVR
ncbi:MAG: helix-turn-helix transcriptional regulator [Leuconostoc pseudomesenteroides]|uniref:helix-turn-helix domain-containing protein n=1 Tax=Leuconostoc pseudomesenteroides TaxID=33968 RepID=UPI001E65173A|nr:helix-turn-helix transcriptional regulator [Leuconostoc pseudomesenteroides]MCC7668903.1 XRE family transcriptional regulator [Leuconostoc pseudomesenteroides]